MRPVLPWSAILLFAACTPDPNGPGGGGSALSTTPPGPKWSGAATALAVGQYANCLLDGTGQPWCWGSLRGGGEFRMDDGYPGDRQRDSVCLANSTDPAWSGWPCVAFHPVRLATKVFTSLRLSGSITPLCGMDPAGSAFCWDAGPLYATTPDSIRNGAHYCGGTLCLFSPQRVNVSEPLRAFGTGQAGLCALTAAGAVWCAGNSLWGLLGPGIPQGAVSPTLVAVPSPVTFTALEISFDGDWACGLTAAGKPYCWGYNLWGQLGTGSTAQYSTTPSPVSSTLTFQSIALSGRAACALTTAGKAYCWGFGEAGELGWNGLGTSNVPVAVSGNHTFTSVIAGATHFCGLEGTAAWCWGYDYYGQLGVDRTGACPGGGGGICSAIPLRVRGGLSFAKLAAGYAMSCGITTAQEVYCWGQADYGRLGAVPPGTGLIGHPVKITP